MWKVYLKGHQFDLASLRDAFTDPHLTALSDEEGTFITSTDFEELMSASEVRSLAGQLVDRINSAMSLEKSDYQPCEMRHLAQTNERGQPDVAIFVTDTINLRLRANAILVSSIGDARGKAQASSSKAPSLIAAAQTNRNLDKVLKLWNRPRDWSNLYKILEVLIDESKGEIVKKYGAKIDLFRRTASNYLAVGLDARHAHEKFAPPKNPMSLDEATELIRKLILEVFDESAVDDS